MKYILFGLFSLVLLAGCGQNATPPEKHSFNATDITGVPWGKDFSLTDQTGHARSLKDFRGKVVAMFFGYTHCPDVCPTTLSEFALALKLMGKDAERVQVLFITVDPERDTPALLAQYVPAFNPRFLGLYTDVTSLPKLAADYKVVYQKSAGSSPQDYLIDHSAGTYVYDPQGRLRLLVPYGSKPKAIAEDLIALLQGH
ncbi:MAG TPA: SCO family protein [Thiobacillaceae bacterium]|nr:SCO family protein [Thiobacillaceae bacterium]